MGQYLYAIASEALPCTVDVTGLNQAPIYSVVHDGLVALVSDLSEPRLRPERRHLSAHQTVLSRLLQVTTPLPIRFGVVSANEKATRRMLKNYSSDLLDQLRRVDGCVEMGLRVRWSVPNIFEHFIAGNPILGQLRDDIRSGEQDGVVLHQSRIELGRTFENILEQEKERIDQHVTDVLSKAVAEIHRGKSRAENDILNLACLVERNRQDEFVARVIEAASGFDANFEFDYNGPWAPHNFVALDLDPAASN